jgi:hypothetical protein
LPHLNVVGEIEEQVWLGDCVASAVHLNVWSWRTNVADDLVDVGEGREILNAGRVPVRAARREMQLVRVRFVGQDRLLHAPELFRGFIFRRNAVAQSARVHIDRSEERSQT